MLLSSTPIHRTSGRLDRIASPSLWDVAGAVLTCANDWSLLMIAASAAQDRQTGAPLQRMIRLQERHLRCKKFPILPNYLEHNACGFFGHTSSPLLQRALAHRTECA